VVVSVWLEGRRIPAKWVRNYTLKSIVRSFDVASWFLQAVVVSLGTVSPSSKKNDVIYRKLYSVYTEFPTRNIKHDISQLEFVFGDLVGDFRKSPCSVSVRKTPGIAYVSKRR
jgi:hypothetical protein